MKSNKLKISIDNPCPQKWDNMTDKGMGRHCQACATTVVDFSVMSDHQIIEYIKNNKGKSCGRFRNDQLNREIAYTPIKQPVYLFKTFISLVLISCGLKTENNSTLYTSNKTELVNSIDQKSTPPKIQNHLTGTVFDEDGNGVPYAQIQIQNDSISYLSDIYGQFEIPIPMEMRGKDLTLEIKKNKHFIPAQKLISSNELNQELFIYLDDKIDKTKITPFKPSKDFLVVSGNFNPDFKSHSTIIFQNTAWWQNIFTKKIKLSKFKLKK